LGCHALKLKDLQCPLPHCSSQPLKPLLGKFSHDVHYIPQENTHLISKIKNDNYQTIIKNQHTYTKLAGKRYDGPAVNLLPQVQVHIFQTWCLVPQLSFEKQPKQRDNQYVMFTENQWKNISISKT
jgi:hypothetical protein